MIGTYIILLPSIGMVVHDSMIFNTALVLIFITTTPVSQRKTSYCISCMTPVVMNSHGVHDSNSHGSWNSWLSSHSLLLSSSNLKLGHELNFDEPHELAEISWMFCLQRKSRKDLDHAIHRKFSVYTMTRWFKIAVM